MEKRDDNVLLQEYVEHGSEEAFAALVARHVNMVYSVALRHTGKPHVAEEITQVVFVILAKKSRKLARDTVLSGWLYHTARLASLTLIRSEIRRARRQQEAHMQILANETETVAWPQIASLLDSALANLSETDRQALILRFFDQKSMRDVGDALGASEVAAKKRVARALEKLQKYFARHGVQSSTAVIEGAISANAVQLAPAGLAKMVVAIALAKNAALGGTTLTLVKGVLKIMAWTKAQTTIALGVGALLIGTGAYQTHRAAKLTAQNRAFQEQQQQLTAQMGDLQRERDNATNQLALQVGQMEQNNLEKGELLKLRGEVAQLRPLQEQLAQLNARRPDPAPGDSTNPAAGANKLLYDYLGDPPAPPANLNHAYTRDGLMEAMQTAAQNAGITLKKIEIDDSEFPFLVGIVCEKGDFPKLKEQIAKMPGYEYFGSVGNDTVNAINITPFHIYSNDPESHQGSRITVRQSILYGKINTPQ